MRRSRGIVLTGYLAVIAVVLLALAAWQIKRLEAQIDEAQQFIGAAQASIEQHKSAAEQCSRRTEALESAAAARAEIWRKKSRVLGEQRATLELENQRLLADRIRPGEASCGKAQRHLDDEINRRHPANR